MADDNTAWFSLNGREWHVELGSAAHERMVTEGAVEIDGPDGVPSMPETRSLSDWTVKQLAARAKVLDLDVGKRPTKDVLVEAITAAESAADEADNEDDESTAEEGDQA